MDKCLCARVGQVGFSVARETSGPDPSPSRARKSFLTSQPSPTLRPQRSQRPLSPGRCTGAAAGSPLLYCLGGRDLDRNAAFSNLSHGVCWLWGCRNCFPPWRGRGVLLGSLNGEGRGGRLYAPLWIPHEKRQVSPREGKFNLGAWLGASISEVLSQPQPTLALPTPGRRRCRRSV